MVKLSDILNLPSFQKYSLLAGESGIQQNIVFVNVLYILDDGFEAEKGEWILLSGELLEENPKGFQELIRRLNQREAVGLGVQLGVGWKEIPDEIKRLANELGVPVISIPETIPLPEVVRRVSQVISEKREYQIQQSEQIQETLIRMVLEDREIPEILEYLQKVIHVETAFADLCFRKMFFTAHSRLKEEKSEAGSFQELQSLLESCSYEHLRLNEEEYGYLIFGGKCDGYDETLEAEYRKIVKQAGMILMMKVQKKLATFQIEANYREQFVQDLLTKNIKTREEVFNRARIYNWDFYDGGIVCIVDIDHFKKQYLNHLDAERNRYLANTMNRVLHVCTDLLDAEGIRYVYSSLSDQIAFIILGESEEELEWIGHLKEIFEKIRDTISHTVSFTATIGIGRHRQDISQIHESWNEARKAIAISRNIMQENIVSAYDELGVFKLLSMVSGTEEAEAFQNQYLGRLKAYDEKHNTEFMKTLMVLAACGWNLKETSEKLYIHYNSMKYRYQKMIRILDLDLQKQDQRLNLELALKLYQINMKAEITS